MEENTTSTQEQSVSQEQQTAKENNPTIIIQNSSKSNGIGTAGFVLALIAVFLGWVPVLGWIIWLLGLVLSGIGVTKTPKGLAIAGLVHSFSYCFCNSGSCFFNASTIRIYKKGYLRFFSDSLFL